MDWCDVQSIRPAWSLKMCEEVLAANENHIRDRLTELGWGVMSDCFDFDGDVNTCDTCPERNNCDKEYDVCVHRVFTDAEIEGMKGKL